MGITVMRGKTQAKGLSLARWLAGLRSANTPQKGATALFAAPRHLARNEERAVA